MRTAVVFALCLFLACISAPSLANTLTYNLSELPGDIQRNVRAHLGKLPATELERASFVYAASAHVKDALQALGYYRAEVSIDTDRDLPVWHMDIHVVLNEPTRLDNVQINVIGEAETDPAFIELLASAELAVGQVVHHGKYEALKSSIVSLGLQRGYFDGKMVDTHLAVHQDLHSAGIQINYHSGQRYRYGDIRFDEVSVDAYLLETLIPFKPGDYYQTTDLHRLQNQLQQTGYFSNILVLPDRENAIDGVIPVNVSLANAKRHYFDFGIGFATDTKFRVSAGWRMPVVNSLGHSLETKIEYSKINPTGRFTYNIPLSHPLNDILQLQVMLEDDEYGDLESKYFSTRVARVRNEQGWVRQHYIRYLDEEWNYADISDDGKYVLPGITWSRTRRAGPTLDPSSGFSQLYSLEGGHDGFGSEISLLRLNARWKWITTLAHRHRFVARAEVGANIVDDEDEIALAPSLRFFAGGDQSIRGFKYQSLGPTVILDSGPDAGRELVVGGKNLAVASLEYQYYMTEKWRVALFTDGGNAFDESDFDPEYSVGTGLHWISPVGAIRFDVGYSLSEDDPSFRIHVSMGAEL